MKKEWSFKIKNPLFWLYKFMTRNHNCDFHKKVYDIAMENNTNFLISQCQCGKTHMKRVHRESEAYEKWNG